MIWNFSFWDTQVWEIAREKNHFSAKSANFIVLSRSRSSFFRRLQPIKEKLKLENALFLSLLLFQEGNIMIIKICAFNNKKQPLSQNNEGDDEPERWKLRDSSVKHWQMLSSIYFFFFLFLFLQHQKTLRQ